VRSFRAHRLFERFAADIEKAAGQSIGWFRGDEYGPEGGRFHIHALMLNTRDLVRMHWLQEWNRRAGWARILPFDPRKGAAFYCAKYVTKEIGEWELSEKLGAAAQSDQSSQMLLCPQPWRTVPLKPKPSPVLAFAGYPTNRNTLEDRVVAQLDRHHDHPERGLGRRFAQRTHKPPSIAPGERPRVQSASDYYALLFVQQPNGRSDRAREAERPP
jgi:hypothetical protein